MQRRGLGTVFRSGFSDWRAIKEGESGLVDSELVHAQSVVCGSGGIALTRLL